MCILDSNSQREVAMSTKSHIFLTEEEPNELDSIAKKGKNAALGHPLGP
jgi:hypothetical protein